MLDAGAASPRRRGTSTRTTGSTTPGRSKEQAEDYRYFPEPDLLPVAPDPAWVEELRGTLPEMPTVRRARLQESWGISDFDMDSVINAGALDLVEATIAAGADQAGARKWWMGSCPVWPRSRAPTWAIWR